MKSIHRIYINEVLQEKMEELMKFFDGKHVECFRTRDDIHEPNYIMYNVVYPDKIKMSYFIDLYFRSKCYGNEPFHVWMVDMLGNRLDIPLSGLESERMISYHDCCHEIYCYVGRKIFNIIREHQRKQREVE